MKKAEIGLIGLAVMGENLAMNMASKGISVAVYNRSPEKTERFVSEKCAELPIIGCYDLRQFVSSVSAPRKLFLMIKAGSSVDEMIEKLLPLMDDGDIIIDGGNSNYIDTIRRTKYVEENNKLYVGLGVSGGEEGALTGPSLMPGGSEAAKDQVTPFFQRISAKTEDGSPCCRWIGGDGSGHFVKMVHNGIEYGDMQLIGEAYCLMRDMLGMTPAEMSRVFREWNKTELDSYLIEITGDILAFNDSDGQPLVDKILDCAGQKGTGKWASITAMNEGVPLTLIGEAVFARSLSAMKDERVAAARAYDKKPPVFDGNHGECVEAIRKALLAAKIISYAQGFALMRQAAETYGWELDYGEIALIWRGGCIIRSSFLERIKEAYDRDLALPNLLMDPYFKQCIEQLLAAWRETAAAAVRFGIPTPAMLSGLSYFDAYTCERLPAALIQAQRDYFGAHTYERTDAPRGKFFHTNWTGHGGTTSSTSYTC